MPYMSDAMQSSSTTSSGPLTIPVVWSPDCLLHEPKGEVWLGVMTPGTELPERAEVIRRELVTAGAPAVPAQRHDDEVLRAVHDSDLLDFLEHAYDLWAADGLFAAAGTDRVVPYVFPTAGLLDGLPIRQPAGIHGRAGRYGYLNNAAVAAQAMRGSGRRRVAVVDIDAHHGNGTQMLFYDRADVFYGSLHVDPGAGWFPHYAGYRDESGRGDGAGTTLNLPLPEGTPDDDWLAALDQIVAAVRDFGADGLVVSLGVDAAVDDPESPLRVTHDGYRSAGLRLGHLGLPTVAVQEGGYHLPTLGTLVRSCLTGLQSGLALPDGSA